MQPLTPEEKNAYLIKCLLQSLKSKLNTIEVTLEYALNGDLMTPDEWQRVKHGGHIPDWERQLRPLTDQDIHNAFSTRR